LREPRTPTAALLKGGEEKSPYVPHINIRCQTVLDAKPTLSLRQPAVFPICKSTWALPAQKVPWRRAPAGLTGCSWSATQHYRPVARASYPRPTPDRIGPSLDRIVDPAVRRRVVTRHKTENRFHSGIRDWILWPATCRPDRAALCGHSGLNGRLRPGDSLGADGLAVSFN
jgi:hypothetical protein